MGLWLLVILMKGLKGDKKETKEQNNNEGMIDGEDGEFHNDFSQVGSSGETKDILPANHVGDLYSVESKTLEEDLRKIKEKDNS